MKVTIIPEDGFVSVDGEGYSDLDLNFIHNNVHALQWYGETGEIEYKNEQGQATGNVPITSLAEFEYFDQAYALWEVAHEETTKSIPEPTLEEKRATAILSSAEFRLNLLDIGELDNVEAAIPSASREVQILWEYTTEFKRLHPALLELAAGMGYTDEQLDALFGIEP